MINFSEETNKLIGELLLKWRTVKDRHFPYYLPSEEKTYISKYNSVIGQVWWNTPHLVWLFITDNEEGYEGSQTQIGITEEGEFLWQYQSHCSCNGYEDTQELGTEFDENSFKEFSLRDLPKEYEEVIKNNVIKLLNN